MDFIVSYYMYNKIRENEMKENLNINEESFREESFREESFQKELHYMKRNCCKCGQDPYFCQCNEIIKLMYRNFNPEKNSY